MEEDDNLIDAPNFDPETTCTICYAEFLDPEDLVIHIEQVHSSDSCRRCDFCPTVYRCLDDYALHIIYNHLLSLKACKYCHRIYNDFDLFRKHENKHPDLRREGTFQCSQCVRIFNTTHDLSEHERKEHDYDQDGAFLFELFPILSSKLNIKAITFIMSLRETAAYICPCCMFTINDPSLYIKHLKSNKCKSVVCSKCCNVYRDKKGLTRHFKTHKECYLDTKLEDLIKKCLKCETNIRLECYKEHVKSCKPIKCHVCNIIMKSMYALTQHQTEYHPMAIQMKTCQFCKREFVGNVALQRHFDRKHLKEVHLFKYKCVYCEDMYYKHPQNLFAHLYTKHQDIMPFSCTICNKNFRIRKKFTIHIKMVHNSAGVVEFDENYNVFFNEKKSENAFTPTCLFPELIPKVNQNLNKSDNDQTSHDIEAPTDVQTDAPTDAPTDVPTDVQTDAEEKKTVIQKKPPKIRYKEETSKKLQAANSQCETNVSEAETENKKPKLKRSLGRKLRERKIKQQMFHENKDETDSDEPLIKVKKNKKPWNTKNTKLNKRQGLTCNLCKKYCYTLQNYNHHMSLHFKDEVKKCIKCSQEFSSKKALETHITNQHSSSRLTETLKNLLERRKHFVNGALPELTSSEKFKKTIKRAKLDNAHASVAIKETSENLSVQKFIEEFTPEEMNKDTKEKNVDDQSSVTVQVVYNRRPKQPAIKMVKFIPPPPPPTNVKLALPVRFKEVVTEKPKITCRVVHKPLTPYHDHEEDDFDLGDDNVDHYEEHREESPDKNETVPEVAQEVMLETQEPPKPVTIPHKILLPKLPKNFKNNEIKIAHLLPEAPFYKIVKMTDVIKQSQDTGSEIKEENDDDDEDVQLPAGTKLVSVNPLAHLLGDTPVEEILGNNKQKTYYKPKAGNFQKAIAKALLKLEQPAPPKKRNKKPKKEPQNNESVAVVEQ